MRPDRSAEWTERNQRQLMAEVERIRALLERHATADTASITASRQVPAARVDPASGIDAPEGDEPIEPRGPADETATALDLIQSAFGLTRFEREVLVLCAGTELDARLAALCARAQGDAQRAYPTFGLALASLPGAHWSALTPEGPLRHWCLIHMVPAERLTAAPLHIDERILHYLTGIDELDERIQSRVQAVAIEPRLAPSQAATAREMAELLSIGAVEGCVEAIQLCGPDPDERQALAAIVCDALGLRMHRMRSADLPTGFQERETFIRSWEREVVLGQRALLIDHDDSGSAEESRSLARFADGVGGTLVLSGREPLAGVRRPIARLDVGRPTANEQYDLWMRSLGDRAIPMNGQIHQVVSQFDFTADAIESAARRVVDSRVVDSRADAEAADRLWDVCRAQSRPRLEDLARRIPVRAGWDDLVLPEPELDMLRAIATQVRQRSRVYLDWGFAAKSARGLGISALFSGPSGTGKTLAAEVLARELRLDLYHIDLSAVVSKYIGETEKNLRRVFDAAESGGAILLFDEADAIFGKRGDVKDSHDRYANLEISYVLQRMEEYRGLAILTTNFQEALDTAFLRRIRFIVHFPFPNLENRAEIWRRIFPETTPTEGLEPLELARLNVAGGNIRNIALGAAFLAADADQPVRMTHIVGAARHEYAKLERPVSAIEIGGTP